MRQLIIIGLCCFLLCNANGQSQENSIEYFNNFQNYLYNNPNADSAFYFAQRLASNDKNSSLLDELIHTVFAQEFTNRERSDVSKIDSLNRRLLFEKEILLKMVSDTTQLLQETARPLYLWTKIQDNKNNLPLLINLTNEFIKRELSSTDIYKNSVGRYALLIYQIISEYKELKSLADNLFITIYSNLKNNQIVLTDSTSRDNLYKRAWYRYLYAYVNFIKSNQTNDITQKEKYLKIAFDYSPDLVDKNHSSAYFYDIGFLFPNESKDSFKNDYLTFLINTDNDKTEILSTLLKIALVEPEYKNKLKEFYNANSTTSKNFHDYWIEAINSNAKIVSPISIYMLNKELFSSEKLFGKWILIDFWGTWCGPCREEHPELQKFYDSIITKNSKTICLLTIACRDTKEKVLTYLSEKHFTFPVAMSDNKIQDNYSIQGYPTKILITPKGRYVLVPFGIDWVNFIKEYCNL